MEEMKQDSRKKSLYEAVFDITIGFIIYLPINIFILPYFTTGIEEYSLATGLTISAIYTSIAIVRKYLIRRLFVNKSMTKTLQKLTKFIKYQEY